MPILDLSTHEESNDRFWGLTPVAWVQIVAVSVLMIALFRFNLARLWGKTNPINGQDANWQHAIFVPLIGLYYLYIHRDDLLRAAAMPARNEKSIRVLALIGVALMALVGFEFLRKGETGTPLWLAAALGAGLVVPAVRPRGSAFGAVLLVEGLLVFAYGIHPGQNDYVKDLGMVITLFGVATLLAGWPVMKVAWFPVAFLVVALPWPELVYSRIAWPLQQLAASVAVGTLRVFGVNATNFGTKIQMFDKAGLPRVLNVAEACAGLKSVMTFLMVGASLAFLSQRRLWEKVVITLSAVPIAIFCNVLRVSGQGLLDRYVSHEWSEGFAHQFAGTVMVIPGFFLILLVGWVLDQMFIEEVDKDKLALAGAATGATAPAGRSKRVVVEVPRKAAAAAQPAPALAPEAEAVDAPAAPDANAEMTVATPGEPVAAAAPRPPVSPAPRQTPTLKASPAGASKPAAAPAQPAGPRASTLKPSSAGGPRPGSAAPAPSGGSTLKPSGKPPAARGVTPPPAGLKPSSAKPASGAASPAQPQQPASRLKPSSTPGAPGARPAVSPASGAQPPAAAVPSAPKPPARKPADVPPAPPQAPKSE